MRPSPRALALTQDRLTEKTFLRGLGLETAPFADVPDAGALVRAVRDIGRPSILKTRRFGYDGKGQTMIREGSDLGAVHRALGGGPMILEGFVAFEREVSVIAARSLEGATASYDLCENEHERHILAAHPRARARVSRRLAPTAREIAEKVLVGLDYVGVIGVEMFCARERGGAERLIVNEIAPQGPQFRALDDRGRRDLAIRAAHARHRRLAFGLDDAARRRSRCATSSARRPTTGATSSPSPT